MSRAVRRAPSSLLGCPAGGGLPAGGFPGSALGRRLASGRGLRLGDPDRDPVLDRGPFLDQAGIPGLVLRDLVGRGLLVGLLLHQQTGHGGFLGGRPRLQRSLQREVLRGRLALCGDLGLELGLPGPLGHQLGLRAPAAGPAAPLRCRTAWWTTAAESPCRPSSRRSGPRSAAGWSAAGTGSGRRRSPSSAARQAAADPPPRRLAPGRARAWPASAWRPSRCRAPWPRPAHPRSGRVPPEPRPTERWCSPRPWWRRRARRWSRRDRSGSARSDSSPDPADRSADRRSPTPRGSSTPRTPAQWPIRSGTPVGQAFVRSRCWRIRGEVPESQLSSGRREAVC